MLVVATPVPVGEEVAAGAPSLLMGMAIEDVAAKVTEGALVLVDADRGAAGQVMQAHRALAGVAGFLPGLPDVLRDLEQARVMLEAGYGTHIALATDMASYNMWQRPGPAAFLTTIKPCLEAQGLGANTLQQLLGGNIVGRLAITDE